jgi:hypothetical protein
LFPFDAPQILGSVTPSISGKDRTYTILMQCFAAYAKFARDHGFLFTACDMPPHIGAFLPPALVFLSASRWTEIRGRRMGWLD